MLVEVQHQPERVRQRGHDALVAGRRIRQRYGEVHRTAAAEQGEAAIAGDVVPRIGVEDPFERMDGRLVRAVGLQLLLQRAPAQGHGRHRVLGVVRGVQIHR
jgi:hypothetical protein